MLVARSDGVLAADVRPLVRLSVQVIAEQDGRREQGSAGRRRALRLRLLHRRDPRAATREEAVDQALVNLEARPAPAGTMTVVLGPGWPGMLLHEAIGHGLEGDFNRKGTSAFTGRIGERVAAPGVTVVDDGTLAAPARLAQHRRRRQPDAAQRADRGRRPARLHAGRLNARLMGVPATGNGRRESYAHMPMPRMTNTYMLNGDKDPQEIIASVQAAASTR